MKFYKQPIVEITNVIPTSMICDSDLGKNDKKGDGQLSNDGLFDGMDDSFVNSGKGLWDDKDEE